MTMVLPCRLITRHRSHIGFTDGLTFISAIPLSCTKSARGIPAARTRHGSKGRLPGSVASVLDHEHQDGGRDGPQARLHASGSLADVACQTTWFELPRQDLGSVFG